MNARDPRTVCEMENMAADHDTLDRGCCMACALDASATHDRYVPTALSHLTETPRSGGLAVSST